MTKVQRQARLRLAAASLEKEQASETLEALEVLLANGLNAPAEKLVVCGDKLLARLYHSGTGTDVELLEGTLKAYTAAKVSPKEFVAIGRELLVWHANLDGGLRAYQAAGVEPPPNHLRLCARILLSYGRLDEARAAYRAARSEVPADELLYAADGLFRYGRDYTAVEYCRAALGANKASGSRVSKTKLLRCRHCVQRYGFMLGAAEQRRLSRLVDKLERASD